MYVNRNMPEIVVHVLASVKKIVRLVNTRKTVNE